MEWTNRYQHKMTLAIRVWPEGEPAQKASCEKSEWTVDGTIINRNEHLAVCHFHTKKLHYNWEMSDADANRLAAAGSAGAKFGKMIVRTPGTLNNSVKKECWLEVPLIIYPMAPELDELHYDSVMRGSEAEIAETVKAAWRRDINRARRWRQKRYGYGQASLDEWQAEQPVREFTGVHYIVNPELIDLQMLAEIVMEGKAILVDKRLKGTVSVREINHALSYWVDKSKAPDEPGGEFMGWELGRSIFWCENADIPEWLRSDGRATVKEIRRAARRERMSGKMQRYYIEQVTNRIAKKYGISRERVASRFIEEGFLEWMAEESAKIIEDPARMKFPGVEARCHGPVDDAVKALSFCIDCMAIRPPDPIPPLLTPKQQELRLEYQRKKLDAFNKLSPEEQAKVIAKREHRARNTPEGLLKRIVTAYAAEEGRDREEVFAELRDRGIVDLVISGLKMRRMKRPIGAVVGKALVKHGVRAVRIFIRCNTGEVIDSWRDANVAGRA